MVRVSPFSRGSRGPLAVGGRVAFAITAMRWSSVVTAVPNSSPSDCTRADDNGPPRKSSNSAGVRGTSASFAFARAFRRMPSRTLGLTTLSSVSRTAFGMSSARDGEVVTPITP